MGKMIKFCCALTFVIVPGIAWALETDGVAVSVSRMEGNSIGGTVAILKVENRTGADAKYILYKCVLRGPDKAPLEVESGASKNIRSNEEAFNNIVFGKEYSKDNDVACRATDVTRAP